jgi:hypothetical protein
MAELTFTKENITNTPSWRVALLLLFFVCGNFFLDFILDRLEHALRKKHGILGLLNRLKTELVALGLTSLFFTSLQVRKMHYQRMHAPWSMYASSLARCRHAIWV